MKRGISRRRFMACAGGIVVGGGIYGLVWGPRDLRVVRAAVTIRGLPAPFDGLRIVHMSDFHRGRWVSEDQVRRAGDLARELSPDLVVLTGDYVTGKASYAWSCVDALGPVPSPLGTFAVLGNHDWWTDRAVVKQALQRIDAHVLANDAVRLTLGGAHLWLLGVEDMWGPAFSLAKAVYSAGDHSPRILLCHNPDVLMSAVSWGIDLVLSGHTHGGQVCLPAIGPLLLPIRSGRELASGTHTLRGTTIHVTRGIGLVAPPVRFNCPPDVSVVTLHAGPAYVVT